MRDLTRFVASHSGRLPTVGEVPPYGIVGVSPSKYLERDPDPPYIRRDIDERLDDAIVKQRFLVLVGQSKVGADGGLAGRPDLTSAFAAPVGVLGRGIGVVQDLVHTDSLAVAVVAGEGALVVGDGGDADGHRGVHGRFLSGRWRWCRPSPP